jgi:hypothetical protein
MLAVGAATVGTWVGIAVGAGGKLGERVAGWVATGEQALASMAIANKLRKNDIFFLMVRNLLGGWYLRTIYLSGWACFSLASIRTHTSRPTESVDLFLKAL